jgi:protein arginine kinase
VTIAEIACSEGYWNAADSTDGDIVLKSTTHYFRNLADRPFPHRLNRKEKDTVADLIVHAVDRTGICEPEGVFTIGELSTADRHVLAERDFLAEGTNGESRIVLCGDPSCCMIINARDHLSTALNSPGFDFDRILRFGGSLTERLDGELDFARSGEYGVLTARPEYSGNGQELSITLHLPGLSHTGRINGLLMELEKAGMGFKSGWIDGYYTVYNRSARLFRDDDWSRGIMATFRRVVDQERQVRLGFFEKNREKIEDKVWRSYGLLLSCRLISLFEAVDLLSHIRFGLSLGIINYISLKHINLLLNYVQDYHLIKRYDGAGENLEERRSQFIRDYLKEVL